MHRPITITVLLSIVLVAAALAGCSTDNQKAPAIAGECETIFAQMFPEFDFTHYEGNYARTAAGETFFIERITFGEFIAEQQMMVLVRRPADELAHAQGFYNAYLAVFNVHDGKMVTPVLHCVADEGAMQIFSGQRHNYLFFAGSTTYQGWSSWEGALYRITATAWEKVWPEASDWENRAVQIGQDRLLVYRMELLPRENTLIPDCRYVLDMELVWNAADECFIACQ